MCELELDTNGYLTEKTIDLIKGWSIRQGYDSLLENIRPLFSAYGRCERRSDGTWEVTTGGWIGNEEIVSALENNYAFWAICWQLSKRGGYYEFKSR